MKTEKLFGAMRKAEVAVQKAIETAERRGRTFMTPIQREALLGDLRRAHRLIMHKREVLESIAKWYEGGMR